MIEKCSRKQMISYISVLLILSLLIFIAEEYMEEQSYTKDTQIINIQKLNAPTKLSADTQHGLNNDSDASAPPNATIVIENKKVSVRCHDKKAPLQINGCKVCDEADLTTELKVICKQNNGYSKHKCGTEDQFIYQACDVPRKNSAKQFYIFFAFTVVSSVAFSSLVVYRSNKKPVGYMKLSTILP